ncbi:DUF5458 family protein [Cytophagaceae bacterium ABcell3]|nr:DUF5458 family protein [Cytophagaceae bacterium ABcell3]
MALEEDKTVQGAPALETKEQVASQLESSLNKLDKVGGFSFLESVIDGLANVNPGRKARKNIFMTDPSKKNEREALKKNLETWVDLLSEGGSAADIVEKSEQKAEESQSLLNKNLGNALKSFRDLEQSYRSVALFYKNTEADKINNITVLNASMDQVTDLDNSRFIDYVAAELKQNYDRLDLRDNYSLLVIPGYMGPNKVVEKWAKIAHENKVMLVTDFANLDSPDDVVDLFTDGNYTGGDLFRSNIIMTCNWIVGRGKIEQVGEEEDLLVPPSAALAGKMYYTMMSQVTAGKKHGSINEVDAVSFGLKKSEISHLEKIGLVPMVNEYGKVMAFSAKTLFNGDNLGLQTYSVVRVFDYITKVLFDFLNRRAFENWTSRLEADLRSQIVKFLDSIQGPDKLIEKFKIHRLEQDPNQKDRVLIDIHITPFFPAKSFVVRLDGQKGDDGTSWNSEYNQS